MSLLQSIAAIEYRSIPGFDGYEAGSDGSIWSSWVASVLGSRIDPSRRRRLKPGVSRTGYHIVNLHRNGESFTRFVHCLVLESFVGPRPVDDDGGKHEACHNNGDKSDCRLENLRWDTRSANHMDKRKHGTDFNGTRHPMAKLTWSQVDEIRRKHTEGFTQRLLAKEYGVCFQLIHLIVTRQIWTFRSEEFCDGAGV
jgi:hypothetical protein